MSSTHAQPHLLLLLLLLLFLLPPPSLSVSSQSSQLSIVLQQADPNYPHVIPTPVHMPAPTLRASVTVDPQLLRRAYRVVLRVNHIIEEETAIKQPNSEVEIRLFSADNPSDVARSPFMGALSLFAFDVDNNQLDHVQVNMYFTPDVQPIPFLVPSSSSSSSSFSSSNPAAAASSFSSSEFNFRTEMDDCSTASCVMHLYSRAHHRVVHEAAALPPAGVVIFRPPPRVGWGNRVTQLIETALFAVASKRLLLIVFTSPFDLRDPSGPVFSPFAVGEDDAADVVKRYGCTTALKFNEWVMGGGGTAQLACDNGLVLEVSQVEDDPLRHVASDHVLLNSRALNSFSPHFHVALGQIGRFILQPGESVTTLLLPLRNYISASGHRHIISLHHRVGAVGGDFDILENHGEAMIARLAMVGVQVAEEAVLDSTRRPPLPALNRDSVLVVVGADTDEGRERVAQYVRGAGWDVWELARSSDDGVSAPLVNTRSAHEGFGVPVPDAQKLQSGYVYAMRDWFALAMGDSVAGSQGSTYALSAAIWGGAQFYTVAAHRSVNGVGCYLRGNCEGEMLMMTRHI